MKEMKNYKTQDDRSADHHRHAGQGHLESRFFSSDSIVRRLGDPIFPRQGKGRPDMQNRRRQQTQSKGPQNQRARFQKMSVLVDLIWSTRKHLQIASHMDQNKSDQQKAR